MISQKKLFINTLSTRFRWLTIKSCFLGSLTVFASWQASPCRGYDEFNQREDAFRYQSHYHFHPENGTPQFLSHRERVRNIGLIREPVERYRPRSILSLPQSSEEIFTKHFAETNSTVPNSKAVILGTNDWRQSVEHQGDLGTCASFATVEGLKFVHKNTSLSHPYLIVKAEKRDDCMNNGISLGHTMDTALDIGVVDGNLWPYKPYAASVKATNSEIRDPDHWNICLNPPFTKLVEKNFVKYAFEDVNSLFLSEQRRCKIGERCEFSKSLTICQALTENKCPVIISVPVDEGGWPISGVIETLNRANGFHAITIYGYDPKAKFFYFKNTWGQNWGEQGHGRMSFSYVDKHASEAWVGIGGRLLAFTQ